MVLDPMVEFVTLAKELMAFKESPPAEATVCASAWAEIRPGKLHVCACCNCCETCRPETEKDITKSPAFCAIVFRSFVKVAIVVFSGVSGTSEANVQLSPGIRDEPGVRSRTKPHSRLRGSRR